MLAAWAIVALPLLVAVVALANEHWHPVLDLAMTEFRVRDAFGPNSPLIGLPGRIGLYPDQGSHPGPLSFYLLAPTYRLLGSSAWALQVAAVMIHLAAVAGSIAIGWRRGGWRGAVAVAALLAVVIRGYGQVLLTQPWNPYQPLLAWIFVLLAVWAICCGDNALAVPLVVAGSLCAQTHIPYLVLCGTLTIGALVIVARRDRRQAVVAAGVGVLVWLPPLVDQLRNDPGNLSKLLDHFGSPTDDPIGFAEGARLAIRHFDAWAGFAGQVADSGRFVSDATEWRGVVTLVIWASAIVVAIGLRHRPLIMLHAVVAVAAALGAASMVRIFGLPWYYLTLWAWGTTALALAATAWTAVAAVARWKPDLAGSTRRAVPRVLAVVAIVGSVASAIEFADAEVPEERLSVAVEAIAGPTFDAVVDEAGVATGIDGQYVVRWSDAADIGSPGFGLFNELERRGLDVSGDAYFHTPLTDHRTAAPPAGAVQIHLATGGYIPAWRALVDAGDAVEVASYEPPLRNVYEQVRRRVIADLRAEGFDDVADSVDTNLFGASLTPGLPVGIQNDLTTLLDLGQPMAVFIAPLGLDPLAA